MKVLVTGGAGFIGSAMIRFLITATDYKVMNVDKLTYAGNLESLGSVTSSPNYEHQQIDIADYDRIRSVLFKFEPDLVMHLAAESHVDRSIDSPENFIQANVVGTYNLLEVSREYWQHLDHASKKEFRFHHISTDEVFGSLGEEGLFTENSRYDPSSPYSASKSASDHLVRAWYRTYDLPVLITNCSNNYGPYQFPEKLIPVIIINALKGKSLPVYGDGKNIRDWLYVEDHVNALWQVVTKGRPGETYNIGGNNELSNIEIVRTICRIMDELNCSHPAGIRTFEELIVFVEDRPGHDKRYAIDASKIQQELGWEPKEKFASGIRKTVKWYLENFEWYENIFNGQYKIERSGLNTGTRV